MLVVAKPVTWTLDPIWPRKTEVEMVIHSVASESPRVCYNVTKNRYLKNRYLKEIAVSFHCFIGDFRQNRTGG